MVRCQSLHDLLGSLPLRSPHAWQLINFPLPLNRTSCVSHASQYQNDKRDHAEHSRSTQHAAQQSQYAAHPQHNDHKDIETGQS